MRVYVRSRLMVAPFHLQMRPTKVKQFLGRFDVDRAPKFISDASQPPSSMNTNRAEHRICQLRDPQGVPGGDGAWIS